MENITVGQCSSPDYDLQITRGSGNGTPVSRLFVSRYDRKILLGMGEDVPEAYRRSRKDVLIRLARRMDRLAKEYRELADECGD